MKSNVMVFQKFLLYNAVVITETKVCGCEFVKGGSNMQEVRNGSNRLVCCIDKAKRLVEIVIKGEKTLIEFLDDGSVKIQNALKTA